MPPRKPSSRLAFFLSISWGCVSISCAGGSPTAPSTSSAPITFLSLNSSPGDQIGNGFTQRVGLSEAIFSARSYPIFGDRVSVAIDVKPKNFAEGWWWMLRFTMPPAQPLRMGTYEGARRWPGEPAQPGIEFAGSGAGCSFLTGRFVIDELVMGASDGYYTNIDRLHLTFEQRCDGAAASIRGEVSIVANPWR